MRRTSPAPQTTRGQRDPAARGSTNNKSAPIRRMLNTLTHSLSGCIFLTYCHDGLSPCRVGGCRYAVVERCVRLGPAGIDKLQFAMIVATIFRLGRWTDLFLLVGTGAVTLTDLVCGDVTQPQSNCLRPNTSYSCAVRSYSWQRKVIKQLVQNC
jgi:hypothetical protein